MSDQPLNIQDMQLFNGKEQYRYFSSIKDIAPVREIAPSSNPCTFPEGEKTGLPEYYSHEGEQRSLRKLIDDTHTAALLVLKDGKIRYENYWLTGGRDVQWMSMSVCKSWTAALIGIALGEGLIESLNDPIDKYVPFLSTGGYGGVPILDILRMSSGTLFSESYEHALDPDSDFSKFMAIIGSGRTKAYLATIPKTFTPGSKCNYNSYDAMVLGWVVMAVYGKSFTEVLQEKLCEPLGTEYPGYIMVAADGDEPTCGGVVNFTARDYAKLGELYRLGGKLRGKQIVPAGYVKASVTVSAPQFAPSMPIMGNKRFAPGYGYLWWIPEPGKDFTALGVYNQFVYCNPGDGTVIVKLSANPRYGISTLDSDSKDAENISALQAISASLVR